MADLDPLGINSAGGLDESVPRELDLQFYGFTEKVFKYFESILKLLKIHRIWTVNFCCRRAHSSEAIERPLLCAKFMQGLR